MYSSALHEKVTISSKYTKENFYLTGEKMTYMAHWKVLHALQSLNVLQDRTYSLWCRVNAVLLPSDSSILSGQ